MGATLEETLAELQASKVSPATPQAASPAGGSSPQGPGGGAAPSAQGDGVSPASPTGAKPTDYTPYDHAVGAAVRGFSDAATFGFSDEIGGALDTLGLDGGENIWNSRKGFGDILAGNIAKERAILANDRKEHSYTSFGGTIVGSLVMPLSKIGGGIKGVALGGAAQGGLYGVGSGEGVADRAEKGATGAIIGGVLGAALGKAGQWVSSKFSKAAPVADDVGEGLVGSVTDTGGPYAPGTILPDQIPPSILALDEAGQPIMGAVPAGEHQAPLNALVRAGDDAAEAGAAKATAAAQGATEEASKDLVTLTIPGARQGAEEGAEETVGTIGREELAKIQKAVSEKAPAIKADERAADYTWETAPDVTARVGEWRIGSLGGSEEARALLSGLARTVTPGKVSRTDAELMSEARAMADSIGEDPEAVLGLAKELSGQVGSIDSSMATLRTVWSRMSSDITDLHLMGVDWSTASDDMVSEAAQRIYNLSTLSGEVQRIKTGLGRGLRVQQLPSADEYMARLAGRLDEGVATDLQAVNSPLPETRQQIADWLDIWGTTGGDPKRQAAILQGRLTLPSPGRYLRQSVANLFTANILSAPKTVALNLVGPGVTSTVRQIERHVGASAASINPLLTQQERQAARAVAASSAKAWLTSFTQIQDTFRMALVAGQRNRSVIGGGGSTVDTLSSFGPVTKNLREAAIHGTDSVAADFAYGLGNALNFWPRAFARLNNGLDEFAKRTQYLTEVRTDAMVAASQQGLDGQAARDYIVQRMASAFNPEGHATSEELLRMAERTTLTGTVGEPGTALRAFGNTMQAARNAVPELRFILPVFNVAANGIAETLRRLPTAALPGLMGKGMTHTADELAGVYGAVAQADAHGRMILGASWMTAGIMMARSGRITGAGPQDPTDRKTWLATHQPYSIKMGDTWVRYDKYDIIGGLLSIPATVHDATIYNAEDQATSDVITSGIGSLAQWFKDKAALRNATGFLALGDDPTKSAGQMFTQLGGSVASGLTIPAWLRASVTDTTSPEMAMKKSWMDYVQAATPVWANHMEPVRNVLGEPVIKANETPGEAIFPVTLVKAIGYDDDPVLDELDRLYQVTGYGAGADSNSLSYGHFDPKTVKLEDGKTLYYRAMQMRQHLELDGKTLRQSLDELFKSDDYNAAKDGGSKDALPGFEAPDRTKMVSGVFKRYNAAIKVRIASESPLGKEWLIAGAAKRADTALVGSLPAEDLVKNPGLYAIKGVSREKLEENLMGDAGTNALLEALDGGSK